MNYKLDFDINDIKESKRHIIHIQDEMDNLKQGLIKSVRKIEKLHKASD